MLLLLLRETIAPLGVTTGKEKEEEEEEGLAANDFPAPSMTVVGAEMELRGARLDARAVAMAQALWSGQEGWGQGGQQGLTALK